MPLAKVYVHVITGFEGGFLAPDLAVAVAAGARIIHDCSVIQKLIFRAFNDVEGTLDEVRIRLG
jgi:hypothetical protein